MTNKPLILGVVTTLLMAGGQAYAQQACPAEALLGDIGGVSGVSGGNLGFSCRLGDTVLSNFTFAGGSDPQQMANDSAEFLAGGFNLNNLRGSLVTVTFIGPDGAPLPSGSLDFSYKISIAPGFPPPADIGAKFINAEYVVVDAPVIGPPGPGFNAGVTVTRTLVGDNTGQRILSLNVNFPGLLNSGASPFFDENFSVLMNASQSPGTQTRSIAETWAVVTKTPEPTTLSLFAIGLAGLGFSARGKRRN